METEAKIKILYHWKKHMKTKKKVQELASKWKNDYHG